MSEEDSMKLRDLLIREPEIAEWLEAQPPQDTADSDAEPASSPARA